MFSFLNSNSQSLTCAYPSVRETIPRSSLGYKTNNIYPQFPPLMSDGRAITSTHQPEAVINNELIQSSGIKTNWQYRNYLTHNAGDIMEYNFRESCNDVGYIKRFGDPTAAPDSETKPQFTGSSVVAPYIYRSYHDNSQVLGVSNSDLRQNYLSREQLNSRKISPAITQEELLRMQ